MAAATQNILSHFGCGPEFCSLESMNEKMVGDRSFSLKGKRKNIIKLNNNLSSQSNCGQLWHRIGHRIWKNLFNHEQQKRIRIYIRFLLHWDTDRIFFRQFFVVFTLLFCNTKNVQTVDKNIRIEMMVSWETSI